MIISKFNCFLLLVIMIIHFHPASAENIKNVTLTYNASDFVLTERDGLLYINSDKYSFSFDTDTRAPALPYFGIYVWIDNKYEYEGHNIVTNDTLLRSNVFVAPNIEPTPSSYNSHQVQRLKKSFLLEKYPNNCVEYIGSSEIGGNKILCFSVCPFQYFTSSKELYLEKDITISISLSSRSFDTSIIGTNPIDLIGNLVVNKDEMVCATTPHVAQTREFGNNGFCDYLIITCDSLKREFQRLADWKTMKGVRTKVITTDSIYLHSTETRSQLQIKKVIMDYYEDSNHKLKYVLLGGDHDIVPAEHCRLDMSLINIAETLDIPTDLYYASLKTLDWDKNGNGVIGEISDALDIIHDIYVTRLSINSISDAHNQINRIIKYEMNPDTTNWEDNFLMSGQTLNDAYYNYPEGLMSDTHYKSEKMCQKYIYNNWPNGNKVMFYDTGTSFPAGDQYHFRVDNLIEQLSNGYTFAYVATHGDTDNWLMEWRTDLIPHKQLFYTSDALCVENVKNSIIVTPACETNNFSSDTISLSEGFMRNPLGGILGYYGCATYGWHYKDSISENPSDHFNGEFLKELLLSDKHQIGKAIYDAKFTFRYLFSHPMWRSLVFGMNGLCDPEMPIFLCRPSAFNNANISYSNNVVTISTGIPDCQICIMSRSDKGGSYYNVIDSTQLVSLTVPSGSYNICITKPGYIPYTAIVGDTVYIQDEIVYSNIYILANHVFIGSDVLTDTTNGPVVVTERSGLKSYRGEVTIPNGFEIKRGGVLEISSNNN